MTTANQFNNAVNDRISPHLRQKFFVAAKQGDQNTLRSILSDHPDAANWRQGGKSVLQAAVEKKQSVSVSILLQAKADPNALSDDTFSSPMIIAARNDDTHNLILLIHGGGRAWTATGGDTAPLMNAVRHNASKAAGVLLTHGASASQPDDEGNPALHVATSARHFETAKVLLDKKADINLRNAETLTPLMLAAKEKNIPAAKFLLDNGADDTLLSDLRETALDMARSFGAGDKKFLKAYEDLMAERLRARTTVFLGEMRKGVGRDVVAPEKASFKQRRPK